MPDTIAASRSESALSPNRETAISRPSDDTAMASTTPAVWGADRAGSPGKSAAAARRSVCSARLVLLSPVDMVTARLLPVFVVWRWRWFRPGMRFRPGIRFRPGKGAVLLRPEHGGLELVEFGADLVGVDRR